jgi:predicted phosphodiesterase
MDLEQLLATPNPPTIAAGRKGEWSFSQAFDPHDPKSSTITATSKEQLEGDDAIKKFITAQGGIIPLGYKAILIEARHQTHGWTRAANGADAVTRPTWLYRFRIEPDNVRQDITELLALVGKKKPSRTNAATSELVFHFLVGDTQLGKIDGDGVAGTIDRWNQSIANAVAQWNKLGKPEVHIALLGDCIEGNQSQNGRNMWRTSLTVTEQTRILRRMLLACVDAFIAAPRVSMSVVNGNHDQVQRFQETRADDGHATEAAIAVSEALATNPERYSHVKVLVPGMDADHLVVDFNGTVLVMAHGHQWSRGKSMDWWAGQSFGLQPAQAGHILVHGHEHEFSIKSQKHRLAICVPTMESESTWWKHKTGQTGKRGAITFTTTNNGEFQRLEIV